MTSGFIFFKVYLRKLLVALVIKKSSNYKSNFSFHSLFAKFVQNLLEKIGLFTPIENVLF